MTTVKEVEELENEILKFLYENAHSFVHDAVETEIMQNSTQFKNADKCEYPLLRTLLKSKVWLVKKTYQFGPTGEAEQK